jgi:hypothetical protein
MIGNTLIVQKLPQVHFMDIFSPWPRKMYFVYDDTSSYDDAAADDDSSPMCYLLQILFK